MTPYPYIKNQHRKNNMIQKNNNKKPKNDNTTKQNKNQKTYVRLVCRGFVCCRLCQFVFDGRNHHTLQTLIVHFLYIKISNLHTISLFLVGALHWRDPESFDLGSSFDLEFYLMPTRLICRTEQAVSIRMISP